jgi:hypothetical protein
LHEYFNVPNFDIDVPIVDNATLAGPLIISPSVFRALSGDGGALIFWRTK